LQRAQDNKRVLVVYTEVRRMPPGEKPELFELLFILGGIRQANPAYVSMDHRILNRQCLFSYGDWQKAVGNYMRTTCVSATAALMLSFMLIWGCDDTTGAYSAHNRSDCLPSIELRGPDGGRVNLASLKGNPVLVN